MDLEKDFLDQLNNGKCNTKSKCNSNGRCNNDTRPECILVDKVYDSCFQRDCDPSKIVCLPAGGPYQNCTAVFGPGFIVDGTLSIVPLNLNYARLRFDYRVPFTLTVVDTSTGASVNVDDYVEFTKDIVVYLPQGPSEFSFDIVIETRSTLLRCETFNNQAVLCIGTFVVVKVVGRVQLQVVAYGFCPEPRECEEYAEEDCCQQFETAPFPEQFFPPQMDDTDGDDCDGPAQ